MKQSILNLPTNALIISATLALGVGCASPGKRTAIGAGAGAAAGAGIGAIAGGGKGAIIGAGVGAAAGGLIGNRLDKQAQEMEKVAETKRTEQGILVNLKNDLLFDTGKAEVKPNAVNQLTQLGQIMAKYPTNHVVIGGHTDNTGSNAINEELSENRAEAVKSILLEQGVRPDQLVTQGYGESKPVASNTSNSGRAKNRRVELVITDTEAAKQGRM